MKKTSTEIVFIVILVLWAICLIYTCATGNATLDMTVLSLLANMVYTLVIITIVADEGDDKNRYA